jgi:DNA-binding response OmpR family regulator
MEDRTASARVLLVGLEAFVGDVAAMLGGEAVTMDAVDDLDDAVEMAQAIGADLVLIDGTRGCFDPVEVVARCYAEAGLDDPPFVFLDPREPDRSRIVRRDRQGGEFFVGQAPVGQLGETMRALLSPKGMPVLTRIGSNDLKERILEIGFNDKVDVEGRRYSIQTEVHADKGGVVIRSKVFELGRITLVRDFPVAIGEDPLASVERLASDIHRESCVTVVLDLARSGTA